MPTRRALTPQHPKPEKAQNESGRFRERGIVSWRRAGFRLFWRGRSRGRKPGRPTISEELRQLIRRRQADHPSWSAPRLYGKRLPLGFEISELTVSRYLRRIKPQGNREKARRWRAFLHNHREVIAAMDFFTVPTLSFRALYCFFVIEPGRQRILHFQVTAHPTSDWIGEASARGREPVARLRIS